MVLDVGIFRKRLEKTNELEIELERNEDEDRRQMEKVNLKYNTF